MVDDDNGSRNFCPPNTLTIEPVAPIFEDSELH